MRRGRRAFTLVEMLLVLVIVAVVAAITLPNFVRSMRGNRLRNAVRTVTMAGRYARSMALLRQQDMIVTFDLDAGLVRMAAVPVRPATEAAAGAAVPGDAGVDPVAEMADSVSNSLPETSGELAMTGEWQRRFDGVRLEWVEIEGDTFREGRCSVEYSSNGRCTPYRVRIRESDGLAATVEVDALSSARTERDG